MARHGMAWTQPSQRLPACAAGWRQVASSDVIVTTSVDGVVKFWQKQATGIVLGKQYHAHVGPVDGEALLLWAGRSAARMHA